MRDNHSRWIDHQEYATATSKSTWLGDIPIIKNFFRYDSLIGKRTELLIVLTPRVVRSQDDMERVKQAEFARM